MVHVGHEVDMAKLNLTLSEAPRPNAAQRRSKNPRQVVLDGIEAQLALLKNPDHSVERTRYVKVVQGGETKTVKKNVRSKPRPWFWLSDEGTYLVQLRYGSSIALEIEPGKPSIVAGKLVKDVEKVFQQVTVAVKAGDLDKQIAVAKGKAKRSK
jgi:hypothetical protein